MTHRLAAAWGRACAWARACALELNDDSAIGLLSALFGVYYSVVGKMIGMCAVPVGQGMQIARGARLLAACPPHFSVNPGSCSQLISARPEEVCVCVCVCV
jgi:hypothetical protein